VILRVFDVRGRLVRTLIDDGKDPGHYSVQWDGRAASGLFVPSGVYFCRMERAGEVNASRKMLLLK
jgi:flagellar hook assembly protein FlgD